MAPRGRAKKRDKRMDAAVETMTTEYGIPDVELIKKVTNQLLDEYGGGNGAWYFIEQYTYKELLEAIIRHNQEPNAQENDGQINSGGGDSVEIGTTAKHDAPEGATGPSNVVPESACSEDVKNGLDKGDTNIRSTGRDGKGWKDIGLDQSSGQREICSALRGKPENYGSNGDLDTALVPSPVQLIPTTPLNSSVASRADTRPLLSPLIAIHYPATDNSAPPPRRIPCYGWIESDEEDGYDFINHKPIKISTKAIESWENRSDLRNNKPSRKTRWDLRPEDP